MNLTKLSKIRTAVMVCSFTVIVILLSYLLTIRNNDIMNTRANSGLSKITDYTCTEISAPDTPLGIKKEYRFKADGNYKTGSCIGFYIVHQYAEVYINEELIYSIMPSDENKVTRTIGSSWVVIPLDPEDAGKEIRAEITPVYESFRNREVEFLTGSQFDICLQRLKMDLPQLIFSAASIITGILFIIIAIHNYFRKTPGESLAALGVFAVMLGIWRITDTRSTPLVAAEKSTFVYYISVIMLMFGTVPLIMSIRKRFGRKSRACLEIYCILSLVTGTLQLILQILGIIDLRETLFVTHIMIVIGIVIIAVNVVLLKKDKKTHIGRKLSFICIAGVIADIIAFYIKGNSSGLIFTLAAFLLYIVFAGISILINYAEQKQRLSEQEAQLANSRISIMLSQIQPHFLYNCLNTIYYLCEKDTETAQKAISDFSDYLRGNMDSLNNDRPVYFTNELAHIKKYLSLEKIRFDEYLNIVYDIQATNFKIPSLSVQPLVENAVKHGAGKAENGGTVVISSRELKNCFEISVTDDGVGFDTSKANQNDGRSHVGIENVRKRLEMICGAVLKIESTPGEGTKAVIEIPKDSDEVTENN